MWPFECTGPNGQIYLHNDNWKQFLKDRDAEYPHNWNHRRALLTLCQPRDKFLDLPGVSDITTLNKMEDGFRVIFEPYPAHLRTGIDPDANDPSYNLFIEDGHANGEEVKLFSTDYVFPTAQFLLWGEDKPERFAYWRGKYWRIWSVVGGGIGTVEPPKPQPKEVKFTYRSVDDEWE
jgi:hypothetical protein